MAQASGSVQPVIQYADRRTLPLQLAKAETNSLDFVLLMTGLAGQTEPGEVRSVLAQCARVLKDGGLLYVQGNPDTLPGYGVYLDGLLTFKYWIAVESRIHRDTNGLPSVHAGILLFTKGNGRFDLHRPRFPHQMCSYCGRPLRDWGGKSHLMNPEGFAASDVWRSLDRADNYTGLTRDVVRLLLRMAGAADVGSGVMLPADATLADTRYVHGLIGPSELIHDQVSTVGEPRLQYCLPGLETLGLPAQQAARSEIPPDVASRTNIVVQGDALDVLRRYPDESVDLVFADPPYNLDKAYSVYDDEKRRDDYLAWCNAWLAEYARILKPTGSLYVLNLPRWTMHHAAFLNTRLHFQNWIVWDAMSEPRGKLMPAHYGLLFYTKRPAGFTFNYGALRERDARQYCLRPTCIRRRKSSGVDAKEPLTDIWSDIHRLKHRRDRDYHPCQLPDALLERIIALSTDPGDIVLDALAGTGTTAVVAARMGRRYIAIDIDHAYVQIMRSKLTEVEKNGHVARAPVPRPRPKYAKKTLQLEMRELAVELGRLPTPEDVAAHSRYGLKAYQETFPTWGRALKAAKLASQSEATYDTGA